MSQIPPQAPAPQPAAPFSGAEDKQYATLATFLNIILLIPALIFYFAFKDRGPMINAQSKENLNWTIGVTGFVVAASIVSAILGIIPVVGLIVGLLLSIATWLAVVLNLIFSIIGGIKVSRGELYSYPWTYKFIK